MGSVAERVATRIRAAMKDQALSGRALARDVARLTSRPYHEVYVSRRLNGDRPLITITEDLIHYARALDLDPVQLVTDALRDAIAEQDRNENGTDATSPARPSHELGQPTAAPAGQP
jgi:hypothetical protein